MSDYKNTHYTYRMWRFVGARLLRQPPPTHVPCCAPFSGVCAGLRGGTPCSFATSCALCCAVLSKPHLLSRGALSHGDETQLAGREGVDTIHADDITVESVSPAHPRPHAAGAEAGVHFGGTSAGGGMDSSSEHEGVMVEGPAEDVTVVDHFARAKLTNYIKRVSREDARFQTTEIKQDESGAPTFRSSILVPVPPQYGPRVAEGTAMTAKDAEALAAMHGTAIIDALGLQLYTLPSMQRKHAEQAKAAGRWAPMPDDRPRPPETASPPAKRKLTFRDESEDGRWQLLDVTPRHFQCPSHTLLSPAIIDGNAPHRIRKMYERVAYRQQRQPNPANGSSTVAALTFDDSLSVFNSTNLPDAPGSPMTAAEGGVSMFVAELRLPVPDALGCVLAKGKAQDRGTAVVLCCMHAELVLDAIGFPIYFDDAVLQNIHAQAARSFGRFAPMMTGDMLMSPAKAAVPLPLKQQVLLPPPAAAAAPPASDGGSTSLRGGGGAKGTAESSSSVPRRRFAPFSDDERLVQDHLALIEASTTFENITVLDPSAVAVLQEYLTHCAKSKRTDPFFIEKIGGTTYRATVVLPMPQGTAVPTSPSSSSSAAGAAIGAMGIAFATSDAEVLCAMHAVEILCRLGIPLSTDAAKQAAVEERRRRDGLPMPGPGVTFPAAYRRMPSAAAAPSPSHDASVTTPVDSSPNAAMQQQALLNAKFQVEQERLAVVRAEKLATIKAAAAENTKASSPTGAEHTKTKTTTMTPTAAAGRRTPVTVTLDPDNITPVDFRKQRDITPIPHWSLTPDSPDGFIVVGPRQTLDNAVSFGHSLVSPRQIDMLARERLNGFLQSLGKRPEAMIRTVKLVTFDSVPLYRTTVRLPVPSGFGERQAIGEAPDATESEILASMHAELIIDTLGLPWYVDPKQQKKHANSARKMGRFAPMPGDSPQPYAVASPPPLRKERTDSLTWHKHVMTKYGRDVTVQEASAIEGKEEALAWRVALRSSSFEAISPETIDLTSRERVRGYLRRVQRRADELEYVVEAQGPAIHHIARMVVPLPVRFGVRHAIGVALSKKEADALCWMHAERVIDAMGIHLFNLPGLQKRHAERVAKAGRWAPMPGETVNREENFPSPLPLKTDDIGVKPKYPMPPPGGAINPTSWRQYVLDCVGFIEAKQKHQYAEFLAYDRVPRTGDFLIDDALDEVERSEVDKQVKSTLQTYCTQANVEYPVRWRNVLVGSASCRKSLTTVPIPGYEHIVAAGVGPSKDVSQKRAAMHILAVLRRLDPDFVYFDLCGSNNSAAGSQQSADAASGSSPQAPGPRRGGGKRQDPGSWDRWTRSFTDEGKVRLLNLFALCSGMTPPVVQHRQRNDGGILSYVTSVELVDIENSRKYIGRATEAGRKINEPAAYDDLFHQMLAKVPSFGSLGHFLRSHPHLDPEHVVTLSLPNDIEDAILAVAPPVVQPDDPTTTTKASDIPRHATSNAYETLVDQEAEALLPPQPVVVEQAVVDSGAAASQPLAQEASTATLSQATDVRDAASADRVSGYLKQKKVMKLQHPDYVEKFGAKRSALSINGKREELLALIRNNPVTVICGTTGCGKTTQVPQFILDAETDEGRGGACSIVVTQPRRLSAVSIATRIAAERLEDIGDVVGYTIRLESRPGKNINFCTSGVLLRILQAKPMLEGIQYVIIDEIHERDINSDFLLILLKDLLQRRRDLRVILMSATLQSQLFAGYFGGAPVINVEGYVHPVRELYLEDVAEFGKAKGFSSASIKCLPSAAANSSAAAADAATTEPSTPTATPPAGATASQYDFKEASTDIDYAALIFTIDHVSSTENTVGGSILVFLPGWEEITRTRDLLAGASKYHVILLHSSVSAEEQMHCFLPAPEGKIKLILSTNIAESGVTIDDIVVVIDVGLSKEKSYFLRKGRTAVGRNEVGSMSQLVTIFASRANCVQRRGRAGRTRPGVCIRLYPKQQFNALAEFQLPEMLRQPLDSLCLQIMSLKLGDPSDFLQRALEPPAIESIEAAMARLRGLGATTKDRQLTPLGQRLALLPVAPRLGKMILYGVVLKCLDSVLTIAAASEQDAFLPQRELKDVVRINRVDFARESQSDHIALLNAYNAFVRAKLVKSEADLVKWLSEKTLNRQALDVISKYKRQFYDILVGSGFVDPSSAPPLAVAQRDDLPPTLTTPRSNDGDSPSSRLAGAGGCQAGVEPATSRDAHPGEEQNIEKPALSLKIRAALLPTNLEDDDAIPISVKSSSSSAGNKSQEAAPLDDDAVDAPFVDRSHYSSDSNNVPLVKAALCTGLFPNVAVFREKRIFRSKLENMLMPFPQSVVSKNETDDITNPFFIFEEVMQSGMDVRVLFKGASCVSLWAMLLVGANEETHIRFRDDLNLMILDDWIVFRATGETMELLHRLKYAITDCAARKFASAVDPGNDVRLAKLQHIIKKLVNIPMRPNALVDGSTTWEDHGVILDALGETTNDSDDERGALAVGGAPAAAASLSQTSTVDGHDDVDGASAAPTGSTMTTQSEAPRCLVPPQLPNPLPPPPSAEEEEECASELMKTVEQDLTAASTSAAPS